MRVRLRKLDSRFPGGVAPVLSLWALLLGWLALYLFLEGQFGFCLFRRLTGIACPSCGLFRSFGSLLAGKPLAALLCNPFMLLFTLFALFQQGAILIFTRELTLSATRGQKRAIGWVLVALFFLNWGYLLWVARI